MRSKAACTRKTSHVLANFEVRDAFPHGLHHACIFRPGHEGQGRLHLVFVLNNQQIRKVKRRGFDLDHIKEGRMIV